MKAKVGQKKGNSRRPLAIKSKSITKDEKIAQLKAKEGHYIIASNTFAKALSDKEVVTAYQKQYHVERGFRFLKYPLFFASSLFVKTPQRIMGVTNGHAALPASLWYC